jgi:hypothetical protein
MIEDLVTGAERLRRAPVAATRPAIPWRT